MPVTQPVDFNAMVNKPTTIAGYGITDASQLGVGQSWSNVTASRAFSTTYTNSTGKPIMVVIRFQASGGSAGLSISINGAAGMNVAINANLAGAGSAGGFIVPAGATYNASVTGGTMNEWLELR